MRLAREALMVVFCGAGLAFLAGFASCNKQFGRDAYRYRLGDDCETHCEQAGKAGYIDKDAMECVCAEIRR